MAEFYRLLKLMESDSTPENVGVSTDMVTQALEQLPSLLSWLEKLIQEYEKMLQMEPQMGPQQQSVPQTQRRQFSPTFEKFFGPAYRRLTGQQESICNFGKEVKDILEFIELNINSILLSEATQQQQQLLDNLKKVFQGLKSNFNTLSSYAASLSGPQGQGGGSMELSDKSVKSLARSQSRAAKQTGQAVSQGIASGFDKMKPDPKWADAYANMASILNAIANTGLSEIGYNDWIKIYPGAQGSGARGNAIDPYNPTGWKKLMEDQYLNKGNSVWRLQINKNALGFTSASPTDQDIKLFDPFRGDSDHIANVIDWINTDATKIFNAYRNKYKGVAGIKEARYYMGQILNSIAESKWAKIGYTNWVKVYQGTNPDTFLDPYNDSWKAIFEQSIQQGNYEWNMIVNHKDYFPKNPQYSGQDSISFNLMPEKKSAYKAASLATNWLSKDASKLFAKARKENIDIARNLEAKFKQQGFRRPRPEGVPKPPSEKDLSSIDISNVKVPKGAKIKSV